MDGDLSLGSRAVEYYETIGLSSSQPSISLRDALMKCSSFPFQAIGRAAAQPLARNLHWNVEQEGQVWTEPASCVHGDPHKGFYEKASAVSLVSNCCIPKPVAHNQPAFAQRGLDDFVNELSARRVEQETFRLARHLAQWIDQELADLLTKRCAARLASEDEWNGRVGKGIVQQSNLRGFACTFDSFEGDEQPALYRAASLYTRTRRLGSTPVDRDCRLYFSTS